MKADRHLLHITLLLKGQIREELSFSAGDSGVIITLLFPFAQAYRSRSIAIPPGRSWMRRATDPFSKNFGLTHTNE